jgi:hypothetical protein
MLHLMFTYVALHYLPLLLPVTAADRGHCEALLVPLLGQLICPELESVTDKAVTDGDHETDADEGWVGSRLLRMQSLDDLPEVSCIELLHYDTPNTSTATVMVKM